MPAIKVAVIGAGSAGLCCGRHLLSEPDIFAFDIFEQQEEVGGTWKYSERIGEDEFGLPVHSSMYKNLKANLPKETMAFPDFPFPHCNGQSFVHHTEVLQYLKDYARHYGVYKYIKFHKLVENVKPVKHSDGRVEWSVSYSDVATKEVETNMYDAVMVCNGHYSVPYIPEIPGLSDFEGVLMHSHDYRVPSVFKDMKVVVLGAHASGVDIAIESSSVAKEVILSHNDPFKTSPLPENLKQEKGIESVGKTTVTFTDGKTYECDAIILCTGYLYQYPFLDPSCNVHIDDQRVTPLYLHTFHIDFPTMYILAVTKMILPFPIYDNQVKVILKVLKGEIKLPSPEEMRAEEQKDYEKRLQSGFKPRHAHILPGQWQWDFDDAICKFGQVEPIPNVVRDLFNYVVQDLKHKDLVNYKNTNFSLVDDQTFVQLQ